LRLLDFHRPAAGCLGPVENSTGDIRKITGDWWTAAERLAAGAGGWLFHLGDFEFVAAVILRGIQSSVGLGD
jgi:hypothetical protein